MSQVSMTKLPSWRSSHSQTARTFLRDFGGEHEQEALATAIRISDEYCAHCDLDASRTRFVVVEGRYAQEAVQSHLKDSENSLTILSSTLSFIGPPMPSLHLQSTGGHLPMWLAFDSDALRAVYVFTGHGSMGDYPSPRNHARLTLALGMVSYSQSKHDSLKAE